MGAAGVGQLTWASRDGLGVEENQRAWPALQTLHAGAFAGDTGRRPVLRAAV